MTPPPQPVLLDVPKPVLINAILLKYCSGLDIRALSITCHTWLDWLMNEDGLWKSLYYSRGVRFTRAPPSFPTCGTWRDVYLRSIRQQFLVVVQTLTRPKEQLRLILPRSTPLYALKREIREKQRELDGVALEDFDLRDVNSKQSLGVSGNDSLPPADLRRLFLMDVQREYQPLRNYRSSGDGWRLNLMSFSDGMTIQQVFPSVSSHHATVDKIQQFKSEIETVMKSSDVDSVDSLLNTSSRELKGPTAFKTFWRRSTFHPLLAFIFDGNVSFKTRIMSFLLFTRQILNSILRFRFFTDILVFALLTDGFPLSFTRLSMNIFPMVWRNQIRQMLEADFDFGFAIRLLRDVIVATYTAFIPVVKHSFKIHLLRVLLRLTLMWESPHESIILNFTQVLFDAYLKRFVLLMDPVYYVTNSIAFSYAISSFVWGLSERFTDPSFSVSLPLYFYALPVVCCAVVLRVRVFLAQSYVSLLLG